MRIGNLLKDFFAVAGDKPTVGILPITQEGLDEFW